MKWFNRYAKASLDDIQEGHPALYDHCYTWMLDPQGAPAPFVIGDVGVGKTHCLYAVKNELASVYSRSVCLLQNSAEMLNEFREAIGHKRTEAVMERYKTVPVLMLDDIGVEKVSEWSLDLIYLIINYRWVYSLPIVATSNFTLAELSAVTDDRIVSRLAGMTRQFKLKGKDRRL